MPVPLKPLLGAILAGSYTPYDLREFVRVCYNLAFPLVRKEIASGKLSLRSLRMNEQDVLYDCLADLFERDSQGQIVQVREFFEREEIELDASSDEFLLDSLRRIVFRRVNTSLIRLHSEADPTLGKILHNLDVAVDRTGLFTKVFRFGESFLIPLQVDVSAHLSPMPIEYVRDRFTRVVIIYESMPAMLKKLHDILVDQQEYERAISFVAVGLMLKEVFKLAEQPKEVRNVGESNIERADLQKLVEQVCDELYKKFYPRYVEKGKTNKELFEVYVKVVRDTLRNGLLDGSEEVSLFELLQNNLHGLTKREYMKRHRSIVEYLAKDAKRCLKKELSRSSA